MRRSGFVAVGCAIAFGACLDLNDAQAPGKAAGTGAKSTLDGGGWGGEAGSAGGKDAAVDAPGEPVTPPPVTIKPAATGADPGFGFLSNPAACGGQTVLFSDSCAGSSGIKFGPDWPCQTDVVYRAYLRFPLDQIAGTTPLSVTLRYMYLGHDAPDSGGDLASISDFGSLDTSDWNLPASTLNQVLDQNTPTGSQQVDVTSIVMNAVSQGASAIAFEFHTENESTSQTGKWYCIADSSTPTPPNLYVQY